MRERKQLQHVNFIYFYSGVSVENVLPLDTSQRVWTEAGHRGASGRPAPGRVEPECRAPTGTAITQCECKCFLRSVGLTLSPGKHRPVARVQDFNCESFLFPLLGGMRNRMYFVVCSFNMRSVMNFSTCQCHIITLLYYTKSQDQDKIKISKSS